jgi:RND family efflux transporter MFP subunit
VLTVRLEAVPMERRFDGAIEAVNQATIAAQTAGTVAAIYYDVNDVVPAGAVLLRLKSTEQRSGLQQAQAALSEANARATETQTRYSRIADMQSRKVVPRAMLDEATANRDSAAARLAAARAALASAREGYGYTEVRAPYAGIITRRHVQVGEAVAPGAALISGLSLGALRVGIDIPQRLVEQVRQVGKAAIYIDNRRIEASKLTVFAAAGDAAASVHARLDLPANTPGLYPGQFVKVAVQTGQVQQLVVPTAALVERSEVTGVYVFNSTGETRLRQLRLGHRLGDRVEVLAGLAPGEQIAVDPVAALAALKRSEQARP